MDFLPVAISDVTLALVVAGATAVGAAVGGGITGRVTLIAERRRQDFARDQEDARTRAAVQVAARLVQADLVSVDIAVSGPLERNEFVMNRPLPTHMWEVHRSTLAQALKPADWHILALVHALIAEGNQLIQAVYDQEPSPELGTGERKDALVMIQKRARRGIEILADVAEVPAGLLVDETSA